MVSYASSEVAVPFLGFYTEISTEIVWDGSTEIPDNFSTNASDTDTRDTRFDLHLPTVVISSVALILINLTVVIGNILVLLAVYCERALRTATNYFIFNLALADLLLGTLVLPFSGTYEVMHAWPFGSAFCDVWAAVDVLCCTASINSLCCISIDRYIGVTRPLQHRLIMTTRRAILICIFNWLLSFLIAVGPLFGWKPQKKDDPWDCQIVTTIDYVLFSTTGSFWIPLIIIIVLYSRIYCEVVARDPGQMGQVRQSSFRNSHGQNGHAGIQLRVHVGSQRGHGSRGSTGSASGTRGSKTSNKRDMRYNRTPQNQRAVNFNREKKVAKTLGIVVGVFILCWFPFFFLLPLTSLCTTCKVPDIIFKVVFWLGYCNSFVNPLIYAVSNQTFKRAFRKLLTCRYLMRHRRRRFHRWSNISRFTASSSLSSPMVSSRHSKRSLKAASPTPEASPMLTDSASPSPAHHATSTSGLLKRQQNGNVFEFKQDSVRDCVLRNNTEKHYGTTNGIRSVNKNENVLQRTNSSSSSSSSCSAASSSGSSSNQGLYKSVIDNDVLDIRNNHTLIPKTIYKNVTEIKELKRTTSRTSDTCSCHLSKPTLSRKSSFSSKTSVTRQTSNISTEISVADSTIPSENNNNEPCSNKTDGALIRDLTPPDLVAELLDKLSNCSDTKQEIEEDKEDKDDVPILLTKEDVDNSVETSV